MADNTSKKEPTEGRKIRLLKPSLSEARHEGTGQFWDYSQSIPTAAGKKKRWLRKMPVHPRWFDDKETTLPGTLYLHPDAEQMLRDWAVRSERLRQKRHWRPKSVTGKDTGEWYYQQNTPMGTTYVSSRKRYESEKNQSGMKPGGFAYKLRREVWRALLNGKEIAKLLGNRHLDTANDDKRTPISVRIPNLEKAVYELIINEIWPNLGIHRSRVALQWSNLNNVQRHIPENTRELFSKDLLEIEDRNLILQNICKFHWRIILTDFLERRIIQKHGSVDEDILIPLEEITSSEEDSAIISDEMFRKRLEEKGFQFIDESKHTEGMLSLACELDCTSSDYESNDRGERFCKNCDVFVGYVASFTDVHGIDHIIL